MKIIDPNTGKRMPGVDKVTNRQLAKTDPVRRNAEKGLDMEEHSPMDPPAAYDPPATLAHIQPEDMDSALQHYIAEHQVALAQTTEFESLLNTFRESDYQLTKELHEGFSAFFQFFDAALLPHNRSEERHLFPVLNARLLAAGEHSKGPEKTTAIDLFEDDHVKFIQLAALTFNFLGLAARLPDPHSRALVCDIAYNTGKELVEIIKLHIFREDHTLFPLAQQLLSPEEFQHLALQH